MGSGAVRWRGSPIPFGAFIASHVQDLDIPEARGKSCRRKPVPAAAGQCGHISLTKLREWSSFIIREWSLFCNGDGVVPGILMDFAQRVFKAFCVGASRLWGRALGWGKSIVARARGAFVRRNSLLYLCLSGAALSQACRSQYSTLNPI